MRLAPHVVLWSLPTASLGAAPTVRDPAATWGGRGAGAGRCGPPTAVGVSNTKKKRAAGSPPPPRQGKRSRCRTLAANIVEACTVRGRSVAADRHADRNFAANAWAWYGAQLAARPLATKAATSGTVAALGDVLAQYRTHMTTMGGVSSFGHLDGPRTAAFALVGALYFAPFLNCWYALFARFERAAVRAGRLSRPQAVLVQWLVNMTLGALVVNTGFFYALALARAILHPSAWAAAPLAPLGLGTAALRHKLPEVMRANYMLWPVPSLINLSFVPLQYRVLFTNIVAVLWKFMLSLITQSPGS